MLVRTDPSHHQLSYLSIPRDLLVPVPGVGNAKINAAYQAGGAALAIQTVHDYTGVPIDHAVILDFNGFKDLIDAEGGDHDQRAGADPLEPLRLPIQDAGAVPAVEGLAVRARASSTWTASAR